jgi:hypothetical protein
MKNITNACTPCVYIFLNRRLIAQTLEHIYIFLKNVHALMHCFYLHCSFFRKHTCSLNIDDGYLQHHKANTYVRYIHRASKWVRLWVMVKKWLVLSDYIKWYSHYCNYTKYIYKMLLQIYLGYLPNAFCSP